MVAKMTQETQNTQTAANVTGSAQPKVSATKAQNLTVQVQSATINNNAQNTAPKTPEKITGEPTKPVGGLFASSNRIISNTAATKKPNEPQAKRNNSNSKTSNQDVNKQTDNTLTEAQKDTKNPTKNQAKEAGAEAKETQPKPVVTKTVNIVITGVTYPINCPEDEEDGLNAAAAYINNFIGDIRKEAPTLTHENLLVLTCLNLYERISQFEANEKTQKMQDQRVRTLLNKITKDAKSVLPQT